VKFTRRQAIQLFGAAAATGAAAQAFGQSAAQAGIKITPGPFTNTRESLKSYTIPDWFGDAKFGIWSHWGPQSAIGDGDWYARTMYIEGTEQYEYHLKRFGPQSKVGYKDLVHLFTADKWDPEHLMDLYQKAGAKYFFSMGVHHDGFDLWNSKYQPRWNAVASGPNKDVVGLWAAAARKRGLRFGVSEHLSNSYNWLAPAHLADTKGQYAGVPYDGQNPAYADLYHDYSHEPANYAQSVAQEPMSRKSPDWWKLQYFNRIKDLVDQHQPDLLYTDGGVPMEEYGLGTVAEAYNVGPVSSQAHPETVYFSKTATDCVTGTCALDRERGVLDDISPKPWQTDTCIGQWHYKEGGSYKSAKKVIDLLVDIVSKNGNLLLNIPLPASGEPDAAERKVLTGITEWMSVNGEAIFGTRPWKVYGEGPATKVVIPKSGQEFDPSEDKKPDLGIRDIRYTTKGQTLYALLQGWPSGGSSEVVLESLRTNSPHQPGKATDVRLLGRDEALKFTQDSTGLRLTLPSTKPAAADIGIGLRINFV
jgi:alpha-L-fucosidase